MKKILILLSLSFIFSSSFAQSETQKVNEYMITIKKWSERVLLAYVEDEKAQIMLGQKGVLNAHKTKSYHSVNMDLWLTVADVKVISNTGKMISFEVLDQPQINVNGEKMKLVEVGEKVKFSW